MRQVNKILQAALAQPDKDPLTANLGAICVLREKGYSWREVTDFLKGQGIEAEHTKVFRTYTKHRSQTMNIPSASEYVRGLETLCLSVQQKSMLQAHYQAHNRTVTYTELAKAAGSDDYRTANMLYGKLGRALGEAIGYTFPISGVRGEPFYSGALGVDAPRTESNEYRIMMHHELARALDHLGWYGH